MTEDEKRLLQEEFTKAGSIPALLEAMAREETKEFQDLKDQVEHGPHHPTRDELYDYVLGWLDKEESLLVMDHLVLCGRCLREVIRIRRLEEELTEDALTRADEVPWLQRIKGYVSRFSRSLSVHALAPEPVRGIAPEPSEGSYAPGVKLDIFVDVPADGFVTIFYCCEETGEARLVFPTLPEDDPKVSAGQRLGPVEGHVEGPTGKHFFKVFWTAKALLDFADINLQDKEQLAAARSTFFQQLEALDAAEWQEATYEYSVVGR